MKVIKRVYSFLERVGWIIALILFAYILMKVSGESAHTKKVQRAGEPVGVCLLDALKAVTPLLIKVPEVEAPLSEYVRLQSHRYTGVHCPKHN